MKLIYTDNCLPSNTTKIKEKLNLDVILMLDSKLWTLNNSLEIIMSPEIELVVINTLSEQILLELPILSFLCKPILACVSFDNFPLIRDNIINFSDLNSSLISEDTTFINWYNEWKKK